MWHKALLMRYSMRLEPTLVSSINDPWLVLQKRGTTTPMLHSRDTYTTIYICMRKHSQYNNDERTRFFRKNIPLILNSKWSRKGYERVTCERWVGDWTETATYWPPVPLSLAALLYRSAGLLNRGSWEPDPLLRDGSHCLELQQLTPKLTELPVTPSYIIVWHPPASCERHICTQFNPSTVKVIPLISSTGCTCSLIDGWVGGQYVTTI